MSEYTWAALGLLGVALGVTVVRGAAREVGLWVGLLGFMLLSVAGDSVLIWLGVFGYAARFRTGIDVLAAPVEDLCYAAALYLLAVAAWCGGEPAECVRNG